MTVFSKTAVVETPFLKEGLESDDFLRLEALSDSYLSRHSRALPTLADTLAKQSVLGKPGLCRSW